MRCFMCGKEQDKLLKRIVVEKKITMSNGEEMNIWLDRDICEECAARVENTDLNEGTAVQNCEQ